MSASHAYVLKGWSLVPAWRAKRTSVERGYLCQGHSHPIDLVHLDSDCLIESSLHETFVSLQSTDVFPVIASLPVLCRLDFCKSMFNRGWPLIRLTVYKRSDTVMKKGWGGGGGFILFYSLTKQLCFLWQLIILFSNEYFFYSRD